MVSLEVFKERITPFKFFKKDSDIDSYYVTFEKELYDICGCILQDNFTTYSLVNINYINNTAIIYELMKHKPNFANKDILFIQEPEFLIKLNDFYYLDQEGTYHVYDLFSRDLLNDIVLNRKEYFYKHLLKYILSTNDTKKTTLQMFDYVVSEKRNTLSISFKKFVLISFLELVANKPSEIKDFDFTIEKQKSFDVISFYFKLYEGIRNDTLISGIDFERIDSLETYSFFFNKLDNFNSMSNLVASLRLDTP